MNVILSIKPKYIEEIIKGKKKFEFRKSIFKLGKNVKKIYIYSTSPVKKIVGFFKIKDIIEDHPENLWEKYQEYSGIAKEDFFDYFNDKEKGFAIAIKDLEVFAQPIDPKNVIPNFIPPQSFCYFDEKLEGLKNETEKIQMTLQSFIS